MSLCGNFRADDDGGDRWSAAAVRRCLGETKFQLASVEAPRPRQYRYSDLLERHH